MTRVWIGVILIVLLAFFLRIYRIESVPPALNWDEVSIGYNAYSIMQTGRDEWGEWMPLHFKSYGEYKLPGQIYASIPGIAIFGLNEFGVRITPVVYGSLTILIVFLLAQSLFGSNKIGLLSALFVAVSPWHIQLTRGSFESSFALFWVLLGLWFWIEGTVKLRWLWFATVFCFVLAIYTYNSERGFIPLLILGLMWIYRKTILDSKKVFFGAGLLFVVLLVPLAPFILSGEGGARYKLVSVTDDPGLLPRVNEARGNSTLPAPLARVWHSRYTYAVGKVLQNYFAHFDPRFFFVNGAPHKQHHPQGIGELYWVQIPFFGFGLWCIFRYWKKAKNGQLLVAWTLFAFVPAALTNDSIPHALRTLNAMPALNIISAYGAIELFKKIKNKKIIVVVTLFATILFVFQFVKYYQYLQYEYPVYYSRDWQYGYKEVVEYAQAHEDEYDLIVFSRHYGEPHMFTLFYEKYDPKSFQNDPALDRFETFDWVRVLKFGKYYFPDLGDAGTKFEDIVRLNPGKKILFIGRDVDFPESQTTLLGVNFLNGDFAFRIVEVK